MKKGIIIGAIGCVVIAGGVGYWYILNSAEENESVYKETEIGYGSVVSGITESGSVEISSLSQTFDLSIESTSATTSTSGSSMESSGMQGSTQTSSGTSTEELIVEAVYVTAGTTVTEGETALLKLTDDSIEACRSLLEEAVEEAELSLTSAQMEDEETLITAKYQYDSYILAGEQAQDEYDNTIATLDYAVTQASETVAELTAAISSTEDEEELASLYTQLEQAQNQLESAQNDRTSRAVEAQEQYELAMLYYENAQTIYDQAVASVGTAVTEAEEAVAEAEEALAEFEAYIGDGVIYAEYSGMVVSVNYSAGDALSTETALAEFTDDSSIIISVDVTQDDIGNVNIGDSVYIEFLAYPDETYLGCVTEIGSATTQNSIVSYPVTVTITTSPDKVLAGMTADVTFVEKEVSDVYYVSNKAIVTEGTNSYLVYLEEGNYVYKEVTTGFSNGIYVEVYADDINEGDIVYIESNLE